jgi:hypothetical protein
MNKKIIITWIVAGIVSLCTFDVAAQQKRGDTDYTNNRKRGKVKQDKPVNTEQSTPTKFIEYIPGTWQVEQVLRGKKDVTETDTLAKNQTIEFNREARYMSYSGTEMIDSGGYRLNEDHALLYLESEVHGTTSQWNVWFEPNGTMTLQLKDGVAHGERLRYVYRRTSNETSSNRN